MKWTDLEGGAESKSDCRRFAVYATPEGYVAMDFAVRKQPVVNNPLPTLAAAKAWCEERKAVPA